MKYSFKRIAERRGGVVAKVMDKVTTANAIKLIRQNVTPGSTVHTDEYPIYNYVGKLGFTHATVNHGAFLCTCKPAGTS